MLSPGEPGGHSYHDYIYHHHSVRLASSASCLCSCVESLRSWRDCMSPSLTLRLASMYIMYSWYVCGNTLTSLGTENV